MSRKKILYLDQSFLSHACNQNDNRYIDLYNKIDSLINKNILVCPLSDVHTVETRLLPRDKQKIHWKFICNTARFLSFYPTNYIFSKQLSRAFDAFLNNSGMDCIIDHRDALDDISHHSRYRRLSYIDFESINSDEVRTGKIESGEEIRRSFPSWKSKKGTFEEEYEEEVRVYANTIWMPYMQARESRENYLSDKGTQIASQEILLNSTHPIHQLLAQCRPIILPEEKKREMFFNFLHSPYFRSVPIVDIDCKLFALLRSKARMGQIQ